mmetsp:Transcript_25514/g.73281  ORF Transcript_25514/g.73281 Transcript_25514/m.73281 type:complete len:263 (+) Transcript_25514:454-1242(+)
MGVLPSFPMFTSAPAASRASTAPTLPLPAAAIKGVVPSTPATSGSTLASNSLFTPEASPLMLAWRSLVVIPGDLSRLVAFWGRDGPLWAGCIIGGALFIPACAAGAPGRGAPPPGTGGADLCAAACGAPHCCAAGCGAPLCCCIAGCGAAHCCSAGCCAAHCAPGCACGGGAPGCDCGGGAAFCPRGGPPASEFRLEPGTGGGGGAPPESSCTQTPQYSPKYWPSTKIWTDVSSNNASVFVPRICSLIVVDAGVDGPATTSN